MLKHDVYLTQTQKYTMCELLKMREFSATNDALDKIRRKIYFSHFFIATILMSHFVNSGLLNTIIKVPSVGRFAY